MSENAEDVSNSEKIHSKNYKKFVDYFAIVGLEPFQPELEAENHHESKFLREFSIKTFHFKCNLFEKIWGN